jgi:hypothetical protein
MPSEPQACLGLISKELDSALFRERLLKAIDNHFTIDVEAIEFVPEEAERCVILRSTQHVPFRVIAHLFYFVKGFAAFQTT